MSNGVLAFQLLISALEQAQRIGQMLRKAQTAGRDISDAELDALVVGDDAARASLDRAIKAARDGG